MAQILVRQNSPDPKNPYPTLGEKYFSDWIGFGHVILKDLKAGTYEIFVQYAWPEDSPQKPNKILKDYTVRVYAAEQVTIYDNWGYTNTPYSHDTAYWESVTKARQSQSTTKLMQQQLITLVSQSDSYLQANYQL